MAEVPTALGWMWPLESPGTYPTIIPCHWLTWSTIDFEFLTHWLDLIDWPGPWQHWRSPLDIFQIFILCLPNKESGWEEASPNQKTCCNCQPLSCRPGQILCLPYPWLMDKDSRQVATVSRGLQKHVLTLYSFHWHLSCMACHHLICSTTSSEKTHPGIHGDSETIKWALCFNIRQRRVSAGMTLDWP